MWRTDKHADKIPVHIKYAVSGLTSPMVAMWIPNMVYAIIAIVLYRRASVS